MTAASIILTMAALYGAAGLAVALGFVTIGLARVMPHAGPVTLGARVLILPGTALLWPWVLRRWLAGEGNP